MTLPILGNVSYRTAFTGERNETTMNNKQRNRTDGSLASFFCRSCITMSQSRGAVYPNLRENKNFLVRRSHRLQAHKKVWTYSFVIKSTQGSITWARVSLMTRTATASSTYHESWRSSSPGRFRRGRGSEYTTRDEGGGGGSPNMYRCDTGWRTHGAGRRGVGEVNRVGRVGEGGRGGGGGECSGRLFCCCWLSRWPCLPSQGIDGKKHWEQNKR